VPFLTDPPVCQTDGRTNGENCDGKDTLKAVAAIGRKKGLMEREA